MLKVLRYFYRNAFTIRLPALVIPEIKGKVNQGDEIKIDITKFTAENIRTKEIFTLAKSQNYRCCWKAD
jgi:3-isopropylmalate dehydratase small subunit